MTAVEDVRPALTALTYRMLGTMAEAEDAVQETYLRWYRLGETDRDAVDNPAAWLVRAAGRVCLDVLRSARVRRESYVGSWLPEPLPADVLRGSGGLGGLAGFGPVASSDPAEDAVRGESVSTALLLVLETMTPGERVAFVLHDVFAVPFGDIAETLGRSPAAARQLAASARRRVDAGRRQTVDRALHDAVVRDFVAACDSGDFDALVALLDPDVTLRSDGGGVVTAAINPVVGPDRVARFLLGVRAKTRDVRYELRESGDGLCLVGERDGQVCSVLDIAVRDGRVDEVWTMLNPGKLVHWPSAEQRLLRDARHQRPGLVEQ